MIFNMILIAIIIVLLTRLLIIKKSIRNINKQLYRYNNQKTNKKIDVCLFDKDIESLASSINNHIDMHIESNIKQKQIEDEFKTVISNISHDIRTPLTSILGYIQMSKKMDNNIYKQKEYIDTAEERAKVLQGMLNNFFSLSVIQSPDYELELESVNIGNCLCEVISSYYENMTQQGIEPAINIKDENTIVVGNKQAISRVIENLITNLIKYSKGEEDISLEKVNDKAIITISNKCENLTEKDVELLFDRFYKKDTSRSMLNSTGLGLSIAKNLMELMDGEIEAKIVNNRISIKCVWNIFNLN